MRKSPSPKVNSATSGSTSPRRLKFFNANIDLLSLEELVDLAERAMAQKVMMRHTALNVAKLVNMRSDEELASDVNTSDIVGIDGKGIVYGLRLFGVPKAERVAGIDLFYAILEHCAQTGRRPFVLGAKQDNLELAIAKAQQMYPGLEFAGSRNGYFSGEDHSTIVETIARSGADCLFVAMPTPHKERFLNAYAADLGVPFIIGIGGSVDVLAGQISRAPGWMQDAG
ncbi:MAG: WecB/TagA/CpsF family glycosyltransferase, partial [Pseudomonadota bacterium]